MTAAPATRLRAEREGRVSRSARIAVVILVAAAIVVAAVLLPWIARRLVEYSQELFRLFS